MSSLTEISYQYFIDEIDVSYSLNKIIYDSDNEPVDLLIVDVNKNFEKITSSSREAIISKRSSEVFPEMKLSLLNKFKDLKPDSRSKKIKYYSKLTQKRIEVVGYVPKEGYIAFLHFDKTHEIKKDFHDYINNETFRLYAEESSDLIISIDLFKNIQYANSNAQSLLNITNLGSLGNSFLSKKLDSNSYQMLNEYIDNLVVNSEHKKIDKLHFISEIDFKGQIAEVNFIATPIIISGNELLGVMLAGKIINEINTNDVVISDQLRSVREGVVLFDNTGVILDVNDKILEISGYNRNDIIGRKITDFMPLDSLTEKPLDYGLLSFKEGFVSERELIRKDSKLLHVEISSKPYRSDLHISFIRDITKKKTLYESLKKHDKILQALAKISRIFLSGPSIDKFNESMDIIAKAANLDRICIYENYQSDGKTAFKLFSNWVNKALIEVASKDPYQGDYYNNGLERWYRLLSTKNIIADNITYLDENERSIMESQNVISMGLFPLFIHNKFWGFAAYGDCKTFRNWGDYEIQALETASGILSAAIEKDIDLNNLKTSQVAMERILNNIDAAIFVTDMETYEILFANDYTKNIFGDIEGKLCWQTVQEGFIKPCDSCNIPQLLDDKNNPKGVYKNIHKNTKTGRWFQNSDIAIRWVNGRMARLEVAYDISEEKRKEEEMKELITALKLANRLADDNALKIDKLNKKLAKSEQELTILNNSKDKFFSIIAHDLKNPFQGFLGLTRELTDNLDLFDKGELNEITNSLHDSANNIYKLLDNLLHWSRIQRGMIKINREFVSIMNLVELNINLLKVNAEKKKLKLENKCKPDALVYSDINSLNTVLRNLISNAIKFTPDNGKIIIGTGKIENEMIEIYIKDNGIGIPKEKIFSLFKIEKVQSTKGTNEELGTGLGLILCKDLLELNDGQIMVDSQLNVGTTFTINLPVKKGSTQ